MALIPFDVSDLPPTSTILRSDKTNPRKCQRGMTQFFYTHVSLNQATLNNRGRRGENLMWTTDIHTELPVRIAETGPGSFLPITTVDFFADAVRRYNSNLALAFKLDQHSNASSLVSFSDKSQLSENFKNPTFSFHNGGDGWWYYTWRAYWQDCCRFAKSVMQITEQRHPTKEMISLIQTKHDPDTPESLASAMSAMRIVARVRVGIMGCNAPAWLISYFGTIFAGGVSVGIYATNNVTATQHIVEHSGCMIAVVDTVENLKKMLEVRKAQRQKKDMQQRRLPRTIDDKLQLEKHAATLSCFDELQMIVVYREPIPHDMNEDCVVTFEEFLLLGNNVPDHLLSSMMESQKPGECCTMVYTSGTTGNPKGVMLSNDNVTWTSSSSAKMMNLKSADRLVSYLPLSHIAAQLVDLYMPINAGFLVYFARPDALQGTLVETLKEVKPTWFLGVPRVWEKIEQRLKEFARGRNGFKRYVGDLAKNVAYRGTLALLEGDSIPVGYTIVNNLLLSQVRKALGLDQCQAFGSCAAPISRSTQAYFLSLGIPICDIFGLSESTGPQTFNVPAPGWFKVGSIGHGLPGTEMWVYDADASGNGEICFRGRNIFMGYLNDEKSTVATLSPYGFLHTGDKGYIDENEFIYISGRFKELIVTAGGENVAPVLIEATLMEEMPFVSNCIIIGDARKFLSVLLCLHSTVDAGGNHTNILTGDVVQQFQKAGSNSQTISEAQNDDVVSSLISQGIQRANKRAISRAQNVAIWRILPQNFTIDGGELTPTLKLRRKFVEQKYSSLIGDIYRESQSKSKL